MPRYWIGVASREHVLRGAAGGFVMLNHGKKPPLERMKGGDILFYYSPKEKMSDKEPLQKFVAVARIAAGNAYQATVTESFKPFRKDAKFLKCTEADIHPLIGKLLFIEDPKRWGYKFRFGHFEITCEDAETISTEMNVMI